MDFTGSRSSHIMFYNFGNMLCHQGWDIKIQQMLSHTEVYYFSQAVIKRYEEGKKGKNKTYCTEKDRRIMKWSSFFSDQSLFVFPNCGHDFIAKVPPQFCSLLRHSRPHKSSHSRLHMGKCSRGSASVVLRGRSFRIPMFSFAFPGLSVSCSTCSAFLLVLTSAGPDKC